LFSQQAIKVYRPNDTATTKTQPSTAPASSNSSSLGRVSPKQSSCPAANKTKQTSGCPFSASIDLSTQSLFEELNFARTQPKEYAKILEAKLSSLKGTEKQNCQTAIAFLRKLPSRTPFIFSRGLGQAAFDHSKDMGDKNFFSHTGSNGSHYTKRIEKYGSNYQPSAENISAGNSTARDVVIS
jgi:uncharacterized protein YkwD